PEVASERDRRGGRVRVGRDARSHDLPVRLLREGEDLVAPSGELREDDPLVAEGAVESPVRVEASKPERRDSLRNAREASRQALSGRLNEQRLRGRRSVRDARTGKIEHRVEGGVEKAGEREALEAHVDVETASSAHRARRDERSVRLEGRAAGHRDERE